MLLFVICLVTILTQLLTFNLIFIINLPTKTKSSANEAKSAENRDWPSCGMSTSSSSSSSTCTSTSTSSSTSTSTSTSTRLTEAIALALGGSYLFSYAYTSALQDCPFALA